MLESQARISEPPRAIGLPSERAVEFRFQIRWTFLFTGDEPDPPATRMPMRTPIRNVASDPIPVSPMPGSPAQWEMVVPKMVRPNSKLAPAIEITAPLPRPEPVAPETPPAAMQEPEDDEPLFESRPRALSLATKLFLSVALVAAVAIPVATRVYRANIHDRDAAATGAGWIREAAGINSAKQLVLYRPSLGASDGRLEFTWKPKDGEVSWIFRVKDQDNYYGMTLKALRPGPRQTFSVEHFTVYGGVESAHANKALVLAETNSALNLRLDVSGAIFKLYLEGRMVDSWTDSRLSSGGLGFLERAGQPAEVQSVRIAFTPAGGA